MNQNIQMVQKQTEIKAHQRSNSLPFKPRSPSTPMVNKKAIPLHFLYHNLKIKILPNNTDQKPQLLEMWGCLVPDSRVQQGLGTIIQEILEKRMPPPQKRLGRSYFGSIHGKEKVIRRKKSIICYFRERNSLGLIENGLSQVVKSKKQRARTSKLSLDSYQTTDVSDVESTWTHFKAEQRAEMQVLARKRCSIERKSLNLSKTQQMIRIVKNKQIWNP